MKKLYYCIYKSFYRKYLECIGKYCTNRAFSDNPSYRLIGEVSDRKEENTVPKNIYTVLCYTVIHCGD